MLSLLVLAGCDGHGTGTVPDGGPTDTGATTPTPHTGDDHTGVAPTGAPGLTGVGSRLHPEFGTLVIVSWTQDGAATVHVAYTVDGVERTTPDRALGAGAHEEVLLGLPYGAETTFRVVAENELGATSSPPADASTGARPPDLPLPVAVSDTGSDPAVPYVLVALSPDGAHLGDRWWAVVLDRKGRPVWARRSAPNRMTLHPRLTWGGDALLIDANSYWPTFDGGAASTIEELDLQGRVSHTFAAPGLHHPFTPMPDGSVAYGSMDPWRYSDEQLVVVRRDGVTERGFDCADWLASIGETDEYCGSNTLNYDAASDTFVYSFYSFDTIVRIDRATGQALAWFGHVAGSWAFDPPSSAFWWQHGAQLRPDGALATSTYDARSPSELVVRVYALDEAASTLREIEVYGEGEGVFGDQLGEVSFLASGHVLHNFGTMPRIREYTADGDVVWDVAWTTSPTHDLGRTTPLPDLYALVGARP